MLVFVSDVNTSGM